jgi:hypothetical protein
VRAIAKKAKKRGFQPQEDPRVLDYFVKDRYKPRRPREVSDIKEEEVLATVRINRYSREKSTKVLAYKHGVNISTTLRILYKHSLNNVKLITKASLN